MELRHLRYFVAIAEEGSFTVAAERRLHTAQPSLSRQIRDLEYEVGTSLMKRSSRGIELTPSGKAFLDHARIALAQVDAAVVAARRAAELGKPAFRVGFLTGQEMDWLPKATMILQGELPNISFTVTSDYSPVLAERLAAGQIDLAFMREERGFESLAYVRVAQELVVVVLPSDHPLAASSEVDPLALQDYPFIQISSTAPVFRKVVDDYIARTGLRLMVAHEIDNLAMAMSLVASTRSVALLPAYARNFLPWSVTSRPLVGAAPAIDLVVGFEKSNTSAVLKKFLARVSELAS